jgi:hypothetical protein
VAESNEKSKTVEHGQENGLWQKVALPFQV